MSALVLVARAPEKTRDFARTLKNSGIGVVSIAVIRIAPPSSWRGLDAALKNLGDFDAAAFSSANAVDAFFLRSRRLGLGRLKAPKSILAVGPATARALLRHGWTASILAKNPGGKNLARAAKNFRGLRVVIPCAKDFKRDLIQGLRKKGARVSAVETYRTLPDRGNVLALRRAAANDRVKAAAFFSGSAVKAFHGQIGAQAWRALRHRWHFAALGPSASKALRRLGAQKILMSRRADADALAQKLGRVLAREMIP